MEVKNNLNVILVNLISLKFIVRHQAPFAIHTLAGYLNKKVKDIDLSIIDMQTIFDKINNELQSSIKEIFDKTIESVVESICNFSNDKPSIVGLSLKWATQDVAQMIIEKIKINFKKQNILFVLGNVGSTYGYKELLMHSSFNNTLAVVSEGEEALTQIILTAFEDLGSITKIERYSNIPNVALKINNNIILNALKRVDLDNYPKYTITNPEGIYDKEFESYAMEGSRGCPWGHCTFCSIKGQFSGLDPKSIGNSSWKPFPLELIISNIQQFVKKGITTFDFKDSEFLGPVRIKDEKDYFYETMERTQEFANRIIKINRSLKNKIVIHHISVRVDTVYQENQYEKNEIRKNTYKLLKKAGVKGIFLGIESGSPSQLKRYAKGITVNENKEALKILRKLGFEIEVGFILFDPFVTMKELEENLEFIEETRLYETDSRILGSLRIQEGSSYVMMAKKDGLLREKNDNLLCYLCEFKYNDVTNLENLFRLWEKATQNLMHLLPENIRLENYKMNFLFIKELVNCYLNENTDKICLIVNEFVEKREKYLLEVMESLLKFKSFEGNKKLIEEYLPYAIQSNALLKNEQKIIIRVKT